MQTQLYALLNTITERVTQHLRLYQPEKLHIIILGDMAHGAIHVSARVASEEDTVEQLMHVSEILANVIANLAEHVNSIDVHCTYGNHMRTVQNKADSKHTDNLERIIPWWLSQRFAESGNIAIQPGAANEFIYLDILGWGVVATHGDLERFASYGVTAHTLFSKTVGANVDYALMADRHHLESKEALAVDTIICPALCGTDEYANSKRLYATPAQLMIMFNKEDGAECRIPIRLK